MTLRELNDGTPLSADVDVLPERVVLDRDVEHDFPFIGHARRDVHVHADVLVVVRRLRDRREAAGRRGAEHGRR